MLPDKWSSARNMTRIIVKDFMQSFPVIHLEDVGAVMLTEQVFFAQKKNVELLEEKEKRLAMIEAAIDKSPALARDLKIIQAQIEFEEKIK